MGYFEGILHLAKKRLHENARRVYLEKRIIEEVILWQNGHGFLDWLRT